jgi:hypothetical protein
VKLYVSFLTAVIRRAVVEVIALALLTTVVYSGDSISVMMTIYIAALPVIGVVALGR